MKATKKYVTPQTTVLNCEYEDLIACSMGISDDKVSDFDDFEPQSNKNVWDLWN
ncbi:hypothetical protein [Paraprevotella clara]|jgi:hypothetical protein|uniref:hypothetical protein n=1 Tax=Paraprevotella clara TaxID=454154 RepID=UPI00267748F8|nr:hypothetical protein [Paraprevotella clara]